MIRVALLFTALAGQAEALSCMRPDVVATYQSAASSDETYYILRGALDFDPGEMPSGYDENAEQPEPVLGRFSGYGLSPNGFEVPVEAPIILYPTCAGPWCGTAQPSDDVLIFVNEDPDAYILEVGACPWFIFDNPTEKMAARLVSCINGDTCAALN